MDADTARRRAKVRADIHACRRCELRDGCTRPVPFAGPSPTRLAIVGEAPGAEEDKVNRPFVGASGRSIRSLLSSHRIDPSTCMILNTVCCRPPANATPKTPHLSACRDNLEAQLALADPDFVLLLGATALSAIRPDLKVTQVHGHPFVPAIQGKSALPNPYTRRPVYFPTFHPAAGLRDVEVKKKLMGDVALLALLLDVDEHLGLWPATCVKCGAEGWKQPMDLLTYCEAHVPNRNAKLPAPPGTRDRQEAFV